MSWQSVSAFSTHLVFRDMDHLTTDNPDKLIRSLVINEAEAKDVRTLFDLYLTHGNLRLVEEQAKRQEIRSKRRQNTKGRSTGGAPLARGQIHHMLTNPIYKGDIRHKDKTYPGQHEAIVTAEPWEKVQTKLQEVSAKARGRGQHLTASTLPTHGILKGKLFDETGDRLTPSHTKSKGTYHRYYVSNRLISGGKDTSAWRIPADQLEQCITSAIAAHITSVTKALTLIKAPTSEEIEKAKHLAEHILNQLENRSAQLVTALLKKATLHKGKLELELSADHLRAALQTEVDRLPDDLIHFAVPITLRKRGVEAKLIAGELQKKPDQTLLAALSKAETWIEQLKAGVLIAEIAAAHNCNESYIRKRIQLAFLAPDLKLAILEGRQPIDLTLEKLTSSLMPRGWSDQRRRFKYSSP